MSFSLSVKARSNFRGLSKSTNSGFFFFLQEDDSQTERRIRLAVGSGQYHFAMSGKSYQIIAQHFSHLLPKVRSGLFNWGRLANQ